MAGKQKRKPRSARTPEPRAIVEDVLRARTGIVLTHVLAKVQRRQRRPVDPVELWALLDVAERTIGGLVATSEQILVDADRTFAAWRRQYGKQHRWHADKLREAASVVGYLRALGYRRGKACELAQKLLKHRLRDKRSLAKKLEREHRSGVFAEYSLKWPGRAEARATLEQDFGGAASAVNLPDGPLPELATPPSPVAIRYKGSRTPAAVLAPGYNDLWWPDDEVRTRRNVDDSHDIPRPRRAPRRQNRVDRLAQMAADSQPRRLDQDASTARRGESRRRQAR